MVLLHLRQQVREVAVAGHVDLAVARGEKPLLRWQHLDHCLSLPRGAPVAPWSDVIPSAECHANLVVELVVVVCLYQEGRVAPSGPLVVERLHLHLDAALHGETRDVGFDAGEDLIEGGDEARLRANAGGLFWALRRE